MNIFSILEPKPLLLLLHFTFLFQLIETFSSSTPKILRNNVRMSKLKILREFSQADIKRISHADREVPEDFDARDVWPDCKSIGEIFNQGKCEFSWAVATTTVLTDRICIKSEGKEQHEYSAEDLLACCKKCTSGEKNRCESAGSIQEAIKFLYKEGAVSGNSKTGCRPITNKTLDGHSPECANRCPNRKARKRYRIDKRFVSGVAILTDATNGSDIKQIQMEIMINGPVVANFQPSQYFTTHYTSEIYTHSESDDDYEESGATYAVRIIGWGTDEDEVPYWLVANSWGKEWGGLDGFFKIIRGENLLEIESYIIAPIPKSFSSFIRLSSPTAFSAVIVNYFNKQMYL